MPEQDPVVGQAIVEALWKRVVNDATGSREPALTRYSGPVPTSRFWLGTLATESGMQMPGTSRQTSDRVAPASQGFSFRVASLPLNLELTVSFAIWLALHPTLDEQRNRVGLDDEDDGAATDQPAQHAQTSPDRGLSLARPRMKVPVEGIRIQTTIDTLGTRTIGLSEIDEAIIRALKSIPSDAVPFRPRKRRGRNPREADLRDAQTWRAWEEENLADPAIPDWKAAVDVEVHESSDRGHEVLVTIVNRTPALEAQYTDPDRTQAFPRWACDSMLYEVRLCCEPSRQIVPYTLAEIPDSYRYDRTVPVLGINAAVELESNSGLHTSFAAIARTNRTYPRTKAASGSLIDTAFTTLNEAPLPALDQLLNEARKWTDEHWSSSALDVMARAANWSPQTRAQADADAIAAREEIDWVATGIRLLHEDPDLLEAFRLMNQAMKEVAAGRYLGWRPFQLAFILGCLVGVTDPALARTVDILWFSTGGGKTEAYLGLNIVHLFYARLRGRTGGAQTWARFPLRLLSLQQTQRFADSVIQAELIRRRHPRTRGGDPFAVGYYVGSGNTPNKVELPDSRFYKGWDPFAERNAESCRVLERCPACRGPQRPTVKFDLESFTMVHICPNQGCPLNGDPIPVYVIDDDIYRHAPAVLVGTVDKLAQLGQKADFRILLGRAMARCPKHGYSAQPDRCAIFDCRQPLQPVGDGFGGLEVEIQDELHLLSESLGALDGNYETIFQAVTATQDVRIIAATATIEGYREQADHLYRRQPRRFPVPGPRKEESFWAYERQGDPLRTYVALLPRGTTMLNAAFYVTKSHWQFLDEALRDPTTFCVDVLGFDASRASEVTQHLRDNYEVMTTYAQRKQDLERYAKDVMEDVQMASNQKSYDSITGDVEFWDVRDVLRRLESPPATPADRIRILGATSAISHGVDVNRLNIMTVMGMLKQTSEFIQATARVGRRYPGVVFTLIHPMRERDRSHFRYFSKYAEYLDRLVEPVPVNRESLPVLKRVLPGGLMALLLQVYEPEWLYPGGRVPRQRRDRLWYVKGVARAIDEGFMSEADVIEWLEQALDVDPMDPRFADHKRAVERFVELNLNRFLLNRNSSTETIKEMQPPPPRSLRDVETQIEIRGER